jgi:hypothetical protein
MPEEFGSSSSSSYIYSICANYSPEQAQQEDSDGKLQYFKWRIFVKEKTFLPKRAELYIKSNAQDDYALVSISIVSYPGEENIKNIIRKNFGPVLSSPQYQPTGGQ